MAARAKARRVGAWRSAANTIVAAMETNTLGEAASIAEAQFAQWHARQSKSCVASLCATGTEFTDEIASPEIASDEIASHDCVASEECSDGEAAPNP